MRPSASESGICIRIASDWRAGMLSNNGMVREKLDTEQTGPFIYFCENEGLFWDRFLPTYLASKSWLSNW
jgi:hypothetical protein